MGGVNGNRRTTLVTRLASVMLLAALLAGCTASTPSAGTTPKLTGPGAAPNSPSVAPTPIPGTTETGSFAFLGKVWRLSVTPLAAGQSQATNGAAPAPAAGGGAPVEIGYREFGAGPPLLLVEGEDASMTWWSPSLLQALSQHFRVTIFDLPGVGYSGGPPSALSVSWLADVTAGLSVALGLDQPVVLGWGLGGQVALSLAERHPALAKSVVVAGSGLAVPGSSTMDPGAATLFSSPTATPAAISRLLFTTDAQGARHSWMRALEAQIPDEVTTPAVEAEAALERQIWQEGAVVGSLSSITVPVLVLDGSEDAVFPPSDTTALAAAIPGAQHYLWNGVGYGGMVQDPSGFVQILAQFTG